MCEAIKNCINTYGPVLAFNYACKEDDIEVAHEVCGYHIQSLPSSSLVNMVIMAAKSGMVKSIRCLVRVIYRRHETKAMELSAATIYDIACLLPRRAPYNMRTKIYSDKYRTGYMDVFYAAYPRKFRARLIQKIPPTYARLVDAIRNRVVYVALMMLSQLPILSIDAVGCERVIIQHLTTTSDIIADRLVDRIIFEAKNTMNMMVDNFRMSLYEHWIHTDEKSKAIHRLFYELPITLELMAHIMSYKTRSIKGNDWITHFIDTTKKEDIETFIRVYFVKLTPLDAVKTAFVEYLSKHYDLLTLAGGIIVHGYRHHSPQTLSILNRKKIDPANVRITNTNIIILLSSCEPENIGYIIRAIHASGLINDAIKYVCKIMYWIRDIFIDEVLRVARNVTFVDQKEHICISFHNAVKNGRYYLFIDHAVSLGFWNKRLDPMDYIAYINEDHGNPRAAAIISRRKVIDHILAFSDIIISHEHLRRQ